MGAEKDYSGPDLETDSGIRNLLDSTCSSKLDYFRRWEYEIFSSSTSYK